MAVNKDAIQFLKDNKKPVLVEGDRLFNTKFLDAAITLGYEVKVILCVVNNTTEILNRYKKRGKMQSMTFIKGRNTKINNMKNQYSVQILDTTKPVEQPVINSLIPRN